MSDIALYAGRTYDVSLFARVPNVGEEQELPLAMLLPDASSMVVTGKQKLLQMVWMELATETGSMPFDPERGCQFLTLLRTNKPRSTVELLSIFALAANEVKSNLQNRELDSDPDDERIFSLVAISASLSGRGVSLVVELTAADQGTLRFIAPIPITP